MKPNLEFPDFLGSAADDEILSDNPGDTEEASDVPCAVTKVFQDAQLAASTKLGRSAHQHVHNLAVEASERNAAVAEHYRQIAKAAAKKEPAPGDRLEKRATAGRRVIRYGDADDPREVAKRDVTSYSDSQLIAELDADGRIIRIIEQAA